MPKAALAANLGFAPGESRDACVAAAAMLPHRDISIPHRFALRAVRDDGGANPMTVAAIPAPQGESRMARLSRDEWIMRLGVALLVLWLVLAIALPLWALLSKSFQNA